MANTDASGDVRTRVTEKAPGEQSIRRSGEGTQTEQKSFADYSFSSPDFRQAIRKVTFLEHARAVGLVAAADSPASPAMLVPEVPALLKAQKSPDEAVEPSPTPGTEKPNSVEQPVAEPVPVAPAEQMEDRNKTVDPCTKKVINAIPAPADMPKALDSVKDRDPELFKAIQAKVTDPRYTGELGNITVSTHDKKGRTDGCVFVQNVPYWESGPAAQALVDVNKELAQKGKKLEADPLNGAGRTLAQEEAIVWRNSGLHARVGKSNHGFGKAEDFKPEQNPDAKRQPWDDPVVNATLHAHGWRQGDSWGPLKNDLHHWSYAGPGPVTDGHAPPHKPTHGAHKKHR